MESATACTDTTIAIHHKLRHHAKSGEVDREPFIDCQPMVLPFTRSKPTHKAWYKMLIRFGIAESYLTDCEYSLNVSEE
jgi:hypothetical protein